MPPAARQGDMTAHSGDIVYGEGTVIIGGKPAARLGDPHACPQFDGPKAHVGGVITSSSQTVIIGNALAARMGDACDCNTVGVSGIGVPPVVGLGIPEKWSTDSEGRMDKDIDQEDGERGPHAEFEFIDSDQDGTYDAVRGEASVVRMRQQGSLEAGPFDITGRHKMDVGFIRGEFGETVNAGYGSHAEVEAGLLTHGGGASVSPEGDKGKNPFYALDFEYSIFQGGAEGELLQGDSGKKVGLGGGEKVGADIVSGKAEGTMDLGLIPGWQPLLLLRKIGWSAQAKTAISAGVGTPVPALGLQVYWNKEEERFHIKGHGPFRKLGIDLDISIGKMYAPSTGTTGTASTGIPNNIAEGEPSVLIGD